MKTISVVDWFDPNNIEHIKAWNHLTSKGSWPVEFWNRMLFDDRITLPTGWQMGIYAKLADAFVKAQLPVSTNPIDDLIEALTILKKYMAPDASPTHCNHDELLVMVSSEDEVTTEDRKKLKQLGFSFDSGAGWWRSGRFGSA